MSVKLLTEHHLEFLRFKRGCTGSSEYTLVKILEITLHGSNVFLCGRLNTTYMHQVPMSLKLMAILKDAASSSQDAPSRLANKELQDKVPAEFRGYWPKETTVKRPIQGERRKHFQALSDSLSELEIPEEWQKSSSGDQFLVTDTTSENGNRILIFATDHSFIHFGVKFGMAMELFMLLHSIFTSYIRCTELSWGSFCHLYTARKHRPTYRSVSQ